MWGCQSLCLDRDVHLATPSAWVRFVDSLFRTILEHHQTPRREWGARAFHDQGTALRRARELGDKACTDILHALATENLSLQLSCNGRSGLPTTGSGWLR